MKKTLTVNLGGVVFHIDEDAYLLLDNYLKNLLFHFKKEEGSEEIMNDFEIRISELFSERVRLGHEIITVVEVENMIAQMGKPEEIFEEEEAETGEHQGNDSAKSELNTKPIPKRIFRDPDDQMLGGVASGIAAYLGWDVTAIRLIMVLSLFFYGFTAMIYIILWIVIPLARTASDKLRMRGEAISVENIGKTVTHGFEKETEEETEEYAYKKERTPGQRLADGIVSILGVLFKIGGIILLVVLIPPLLILLFVMVVVFLALLASGFGALGGIFTPDSIFAFSAYPHVATVLFIVSGITFIGSIMALLGGYIAPKFFHTKEFSTTLKWILVGLMIIALMVNLYLRFYYGFPIHEIGPWRFHPNAWYNYSSLY